MSDKKIKKRRTFKAWVKRYFRILLGGVVVFLVMLFVLFGPSVSRHDPYLASLADRYQQPSAEHWFGTDDLGRDYFSRMAAGGQVTIGIALLAQLLIMFTGVVLGMLCGYYRKFDNICMRVLEVIYSLPSMLTMIILASLIGNGIGTLLIALLMGGVVGITRNLRGQVLRLRSVEFIEAEKAMGASPFRVIFLHILPQTFSYLIIRFSTGLSATILTTATLSFLGIGLPPSIVNWGAMVSDAQAVFLVHPYLAVVPGVAIMTTVFGFSMMGEGLRDVLDPKYK